VTRAARALVVVTLLLSGCSTTVPTDEPPGDAIVYVIQRGWHTDIGLPADEVAGPLASLERGFPGVRFLTFGFGERQFLLTRQRTVALMLSALLPSRSALLMTALSATPEAAFGPENVVAMRVSRAGLDRIEAGLWQELEQSAPGEPEVLGDGPYPGSIFYAGRDTYDGFYTCNTWTARILSTGGLPMQTAGTLFAGQVMDSARRIAAQQASVRHG
jgi:uncharacterized protein (TIGR02117 family)